MISALVLSLVLAIADPAPTPATPATEAEPAPAAAETASEDKSRLVCRREMKANSRFSTKICKTVAEWEERAETARRAFGEVQDRPVVDISRGN